jgi:hypothetical protein
VPIAAGSLLRVTIQAAQVVTSTSRIVYGGVGLLGSDYSDSRISHDRLAAVAGRDELAR